MNKKHVHSSTATNSQALHVKNYENPKDGDLFVTLHSAGRRGIAPWPSQLNHGSSPS